jgi:oligosaccharide repeat unit polymerase
MKIEFLLSATLMLVSLLLILVQFTMSRKNLSQGLYFNIYWFLALFTPLIFASEYVVYLDGVIFILSCMLLVFVAEGSVSLMNVNTYQQKVKYKFKLRNNMNNKNIFLLIYLSAFVVGGFGVYIIILDSGWGGSILNIAELSSNITKQRYADGYQYPAISKLILILQYALIGISALYLINYKEFKIYFVLPFIVVILYTAVLTTKFVIIIGIIFFISPIVASGVNINYWRFIGFIFLIIVVLYGFMVLRIGSMDSETLIDITHKLKLYAFGHVSAFSHWFHNSFESGQDLSYGKYNLSGIFQVLGFGDRIQGLYEYEPTLAIQTNIFTIFRGLLHDFGLLGVLILVYLLSLFVSVREVFYPGMLTFFIKFVLIAVLIFSFATNILNYNLVLSSLFLFFIFSKIFYKLNLIETR